MKIKKLLIPFLLIPLSFIFLSSKGGCSRDIGAYEGTSVTELKVIDVRMDPTTGSPVVVLQDLSNTVSLPIWIGSNEAMAIATYINDISFPRPMTHDLLNNILKEMNVHVIRIVITDLIDQTYYAVILLKYQGKKYSIDSRPSDAIALALRIDAPIFISTKVLSSKGVRENVEHL
jgi:bifunctional DNase/RNase